MAEEPSFLGVIERLKAEGLLDRNSGTNSIKSLKQINQDGFNNLAVQMGELIDFFKGNALQDEENRRELLKALKDGKKEEEKKGEKKDKSGGFKIDGLAGILGVLTGAITGLVGGIIAGAAGQVAKILKLDKLGKALKGITGSVNRFLKNGKLFTNFKIGLKLFAGNIRSFVNTVSRFVKNTKTFKFLRLDKLGKSVKGLGEAVKLFRKDFTKAFKPVLEIIKGIPKAFAGIGKLITGVIPGGGGGLTKIFNPLKTFFGTFSKVLPAFFRLGRVLGRLFLPITVILSLVDFVKGAFAGFEKYKDKGFLEGLIGGLLGGISGLAQGLIGLPLDLLKSAISWVAGKLGFENFSEILDSFSFSELIGGLYTKVTDILVGFIGSIKESIANIGVGGLIKNIGLNLLKIFKKVYSFPLAVASGAAAALAAALPGGKTPMEAFKEGFTKVFNAGDAKLDSFKAVSSGGSGGSEAEEDVLAVEESAAVPKSAAVPGVTGFSDDQQAALGLLKDALADADTEKKRLAVAAKFRAFKIDEDKQGTEGLFSDEFKAEQARLFAESRNNTGAEMEVGMSNIADAKSQPAPVIVAGGGGGAAPQNTTVNSSNVNISNSRHAEESWSLTTAAYGF